MLNTIIIQDFIHYVIVLRNCDTHTDIRVASFNPNRCEPNFGPMDVTVKTAYVQAVQVALENDLYERAIAE